MIADLNSVKASVGMTMLAACQMAARDGVRVVLSGLGLSEDVHGKSTWESLGFAINHGGFQM